MVNCSEKCKNFRLIEECRRACLACNVCSEGNSMQCGERGVLSFDKCGTAGVDALRNRIRPEPHSERGVSALPPDVEDTLRHVFADFLSLSPVDALLLRHVANGGSLTTFRDLAAKTARELAAIADGSYASARISAWKRFKRIILKFRYANAIAGRMFGRGHAGPLKSALRKTPVPMGFFDAPGGKGAGNG